MKLDILTLCFLYSFFKPSFVDGDYSRCTDRCKENHNISISKAVDGLPRTAVTFHCPLAPNAVGFHVKLFKGHNREEMCTFYAEKKKENSSTKSCNPVFLSDRVSFELKNLSKELDIYTCYLEILVPIYSCCHTVESYLYIQKQDPEGCSSSEPASWILVALTAFSTVGCICCFLFCCIRHWICQRSASSHDYNNEYMAMAAVKPNGKSRHEHLRRPVAV